MIAAPTLLSMFIAGIWHGAGLEFLVYGLMHGFYITVNHAWNMWQQNRENAGTAGKRNPTLAPLRHAASVLLTFGCVLSTWVFFRADSLGAGVVLLRSMLHGYGPGSYVPVTGELGGGKVLLMMAAGYFICWFMPNTQQIMSRFEPSLHPELVQAQGWVRIFWKPTLGWALALGYLLFVALFRLQAPSTFLYFQF